MNKAKFTVVRVVTPIARRQSTIPQMPEYIRYVLVDDLGNPIDKKKYTPDIGKYILVSGEDGTRYYKYINSAFCNPTKHKATLSKGGGFKKNPPVKGSLAYQQNMATKQEKKAAKEDLREVLEIEDKMSPDEIADEKVKLKLDGMTRDIKTEVKSVRRARKNLVKLSKDAMYIRERLAKLDALCTQFVKLERFVLELDKRWKKTFGI